MEQQELQKKIAEYYEELPREAQEVFAKMEWLNKLNEFSSKFELNEEQQQTLGTETMLVLLGLISVAEYEEMLFSELKISPEKTGLLFQEINENIILEIRPRLIDAFNRNSTDIEKNSNHGILFNEQKLNEHFLKLPPNIQKYIIDSKLQEKLYLISKNHNLTVAQMAILEEIVVGVILGEIKGEDLELKIQEKINITKEEATSLVFKINEEILKEIRKNFMEKTKESDESKPSQETVKAIPLEESKILNKTGIEIMPEELNSGEKNLETREAILASVEKPIETPMKTIIKTNPIIEPELKTETVPPKPSLDPSKKLFESFKSLETKTEHSIHNELINKGGEVPMNKTEDLKTADPYREIPE